MREFGHVPVRIKTPEGKAQYAAARGFFFRGQGLPKRFIEWSTPSP